jgi:hypothetical protein
MVGKRRRALQHLQSLPAQVSRASVLTSSQGPWLSLCLWGKPGLVTIDFSPEVFLRKARTDEENSAPSTCMAFELILTKNGPFFFSGTA